MSAKKLKKSRATNLDVRVLTSKKKASIVKPEDLLPESRVFLQEKEEEKMMYRNTIRLAREGDNDEADEKEYKYKKMVMWSGITFFMILILVVWGWNMNRTFQKTNAEMAKHAGSKSLDDLTSTLNKAMEDFKKSTEMLNNISASSTEASTSTPEYSAASINALRNALESASSTATTTKATLPKAKSKK